MESVKNKIAKRIISILAVLCIFLFKYIPPFWGLTSLSMEIAGIFIGTVVLWVFVSVTWPSLLCIFALIISPLYTYKEVYAGSIGNWVTCFILFSSALCYVLAQTGFLRRCAVWFITRPVAKKNPWLFLMLLFLAPLAIGSFMSPLTAYLIFVPIVEQIFFELKFEKGDRLPQMIMLGVLCFASVSSIVTPIAHTMPIIGMSIYFDFSGGSLIGFVPFTIVGIVSTIAIFALIMLVLKHFAKLDLSKIQNLDTEFLLSGMNPISKQEKVTLSVFIAVIALWMAPGLVSGFMPKTAAFLNSLGTPTPPLVGLIILSLIKIDGKHIMDFPEAFSKGVSWSTLMLVAGTIFLGSAVTNKEVGFSSWLGSLLSPVFSGLPTIISVFIIILFVVLSTNFMSNTVAVTLICSVIIPMSISGCLQGVNPAAITVMIGMGSCVAIATPATSAQAAIANGSGWLKSDLMFRWGMAMSLISAVILSFIGYPIAALLM